MEAAFLHSMNAKKHCFFRHENIEHHQSCNLFVLTFIKFNIAQIDVMKPTMKGVNGTSSHNFRSL